MKILSLLLASSLLLAETIYDTKVTQENRSALKNKNIKCRTVCDKKVYKEQKIRDAVSFYKHSKNYKFDRNGFNSFE